MANSNHNFFSLIIPCYNESLNIPKLFKQIYINQKKIRFETIVIDNGSTDNSLKIIKKHRKKVKNLKVIKIKKNIGFGHAIKKGILKSKHSLICYTHGDLQVDIKSCLKAHSIYKKQLNKNIFVKGRRLGRTYIDIFFTIAMGWINSILFRTYLFDIHAQPNFFQKLKEECLQKTKELNLEAEFVQSNIEGEIVTLIQAARKEFDGIIINAAAFTHTSVAIRDALDIFKKPIIELHISNIYKREEFRQKSLISDIVTGGIFGLGTNGYILAIISIQNILNNEN